MLRTCGPCGSRPRLPGAARGNRSVGQCGRTRTAAEVMLPQWTTRGVRGPGRGPVVVGMPRSRVPTAPPARCDHGASPSTQHLAVRKSAGARWSVASWQMRRAAIVRDQMRAGVPGTIAVLLQGSHDASIVNLVHKQLRRPEVYPRRHDECGVVHRGLVYAYDSAVYIPRPPSCGPCSVGIAGRSIQVQSSIHFSQYMYLYIRCVPGFMQSSSE